MQRPTAQRRVGVTARQVLALLIVRDFNGSVRELARNVSALERNVWLAVAELANRELVTARRTGTDGLALKISRAGRQAYANAHASHSRQDMKVSIKKEKNPI